MVYRHILTGLTLLCAAVCLLILFACSTQKAQMAGPPPPAPVTVAVAALQSVPIDLHAVGAVEASATVQVKSQIAGQLMSVHFAEGADIKKGDLLFTIDPRPYQEALRQAEAALARDTAQVRQAEANVAQARAQATSVDADAARNSQLAKEGIMSQAQAEQSRSAAAALHESIRANLAAVESYKAAMQSDEAAIANAKLNLSYCEIHSPIDGRAGNLLVQPGNQIKVSDVALVVINKLTPIFVSFGVPQQNLPAIRANNARGKLPVVVSLQGDPSKSERGALSVIDNAVDTATGTIRLKATLDNANRFLWPGQFVNVSLTLDTRQDATVIPSEAVQVSQRGQIVYVVKQDESVEPRPVTVGPLVGRNIVIEKGVSPGETVVTDGQLRLFPGARVKPVPAGKLESQSL